VTQTEPLGLKTLSSCYDFSIETVLNGIVFKKVKIGIEFALRNLYLF